MVEFIYNNVTNANTGHTPFQLKNKFYLQVLFEEDVDPHSRSCLTNKQADKFKELIEIDY